MGFFEVIKNKSKKLKVKKNVDALEQVFNYYSFFGKEKHKFNQEIIEKYSNSNNPNDCLKHANTDNPFFVGILQFINRN